MMKTKAKSTSKKENTKPQQMARPTNSTSGLHSHLHSIIEHLFLPPRLPQKGSRYGDHDVQADCALLQLVAEAAETYHNLDPKRKECMSIIINMLHNLEEMKATGPLSKEAIQKSISAMRGNDVLAMHIACQNAGLILRHTGRKIVFESFEASPNTASVMGTTGRLYCSYPGPAIAVDAHQIKDPWFLEELSSFLSSMDVEEHELAMPVVRKGGENLSEIRDTANPKFITGMLSGILRGLGQSHEVERFEKHIRDDVLWNNAYVPWRRSPLWLVIKVALQSTFQNLFENGRKAYKIFMLYFLSSVLELARSNDSTFRLDNDLICTMNMKLSRRLSKIDFGCNELGASVAEAITRTIDLTAVLLGDRWEKAQAEHRERIYWDSSSLQFEEDTIHSLRNSREHLEYLTRDNTESCKNPDHDPSCQKRIMHHKHHTTLPEFNPSSNSKEDILLMLADLEVWVKDHIDGWVEANIWDETSCPCIAQLIQVYTDTALRMYRSISISISILLLTTLELWVALDRIAVQQCPLLRDYSPEVPITLFEPLLLRKKSEMQQLSKIEAYIEQRHRQCSSKQPIISADLNEDSFAVRFFDQSWKHQTIEKDITNRAHKLRKEKEDEYYKSSQEYTRLVSRSNTLTCAGRYSNRGWWYHPYCEKCDLLQQANRMSIHVHEWPLPEDVVRRKFIVFELDLPVSFAAWRKATYSILFDICKPLAEVESNEDKAYESLASDDSLQGTFHEVGQRLSAVSKTKSFGDSHYRFLRFPTTLSEILKPTGLQYRAHDTVKSRWVGHEPRPDIWSLCTQVLPKGRYNFLQYAVTNTCHTSNFVIANQTDCPKDLSLHEYEAFGNLRSGTHLQWLNIARELRARNLTFGRDEVNILISQAAWQAGPTSAGAVARECHSILENSAFARTLLEEVEAMWRTIENNWLEMTCARTLIALTARVLSLTLNNTLADTAISLLRKARNITLSWTRQLSTNIEASKDQKATDELRHRMLQLAAICRSTYDVESEYLPELLRAQGDISTFLECAIIVHDNTSAQPEEGFSQFTMSLLEQDRRLANVLEPELRKRVPSRNAEIDTSVHNAWPGYKGGQGWTFFPEPNERWITTQTNISNSQEDSHVIRYNVLSGLLLVDGLPLRRLPQAIMAHPTYIRIFGQRIFDVNPSNLRGMQYQAHSLLEGHEVYFSLEGNDLLIVSRKDSVVYKLLPHTILLKDFPRNFVTNYTHWFNMSKNILEFRPLTDIWNFSATDCYLQFTDKPRMLSPSQSFIDIRSDTASMVQQALKGFEDYELIEVSIPKDRSEIGKLAIHLPRFKIDFFLNSNKELESRQFRGFVIDEDQSFGTMIGLSNLLVLRESNSIRHKRDYYNRKVLIPHGAAAFSRIGNHVNVQIMTTGEQTVRYHVFDIDKTLGRLTGNATLTSRLFKIYLHAVTASCLPDPLTGRTGTEEALYDLRSGATWSFQRLEQQDIELLKRIAALTPSRHYYPDHLKVMQTVDWGGLPVLSQHEDFRLLVDDILKHESRFKMFHIVEAPEIELPEIELPETEIELVEKAAIRNAVYRPHEFGGSKVAWGIDRVYHARDLGDEREPYASLLSSQTSGWEINLPVHDSLIQEFTNSQSPIGYAIQGAVLGYHSCWLNPDLPRVWLSLFDKISNTTTIDKPRLVFFLSTLLYSQKVDMQFIWTLLAIATNPALKCIDLPNFEGGKRPLELIQGFKPDEDTLYSIVSNADIGFDNSPESNDIDSLSWKEENMRRKRYAERVDAQVNAYVKFVMSQWPHHAPSVATCDHFDRARFSQIDPDVLGIVVQKFTQWYRNRQFKQYVGKIQSVLDSIRIPAIPATMYSFQRAAYHKPSTPFQYPALTSLLKEGAPRLTEPPVFPQLVETATRTEVFDNNAMSTASKLETVARELAKDFPDEWCPFRKKYAKDLLESIERLQKESSVVKTKLVDPRPEEIRDQLAIARVAYEGYVTSAHELIKTYLVSLDKDSSMSFGTMNTTGLWPRLTPVSLLRLLAGQSSQTLEDGWKKTFVSYGTGITLLHRAERLHDLALSSEFNAQEFAREAQNTGHHGWDPLNNPEWLLFEIDNGVLVRPVQAELAARMITAGEKLEADPIQNEVFQLNMGEGKSSVIAPIVAASLADGKTLARVIVLKPLASQMFRLLVQKLGDLTNRRIYYAPFSRSVKVDVSRAEAILAIYQECMKFGGILLMQPEHILSFKLMGLEKLNYADENEVAQVLLDSQRWLEQNARDILDESDELLAVKYQLIYTIGQQHPMEISPNRWIITEQILDLIKDRIKKIRKHFPRDVELVEHQDRPGSFPGIRILDNLGPASEQLIHGIVEDIFNDKHQTVTFRLPKETRNLAKKFISDSGISEEESNRLFETTHIKDSETTKSELLLLRGLLACGILRNALGTKRWRVDYGLDLRRSMLAVPYRAKDTPAPRAEFSHPDVIITHTCLSYYYSGLNLTQLDLCFETLKKLDNPGMKYEQWLNGCPNVPETLRTLNGINLEDKRQREEQLLPLFGYNKIVIDFYLANIVFPREAKEFPQKLTASGWDLAESRKHPTTGFSGTNDSRYLLPLSVQQKDLAGQKGTNAKVLCFLLQAENNYYTCAQDVNRDRLQDGDLLATIVAVSDPRPIRVIIDVGAQFLEWDNERVAKEWLARLANSPEVEAAVFFDDKDNLIVLTRDGRKDHLAISSYNKQMDRTVIFLDDVHTRGTDLKLPSYYRAAITLGPALVKDKLVQASMRMRKLGYGQSLAFFAPPEVDRMIRETTTQGLLGSYKREDFRIEVDDVIRWVLSETCTSTERSMPLWANQGLSYQARQGAWEEYCHESSVQHSADVDQLKKQIFEKESQTLNELYFPRHRDTLLQVVVPKTAPAIRHQNKESIHESYKAFGCKSSSLQGVRQTEEQEREILHEAEREREVQRPGKATPYKHSLHPALMEFVKRGVILKTGLSTAFTEAFSSLSNTTANEYIGSGWSQMLLVTNDFTQTIMGAGSKDDYLRPVNWILSSASGCGAGSLIIISPFEANELLPHIRHSDSATLHVYAPKVTKHMPTLEDLKFCAIPPVGPTLSRSRQGPTARYRLQALEAIYIPQINLFAGQLYIRNFSEYTKLCKILGLYLSVEGDDRVQNDGFVIPRYRRELSIAHSSFPHSPIPLLRRLMGYRRKGMDYSETHIGKILQRRLLQEKDFQ